jgi:hypothetical protein
MPLRTFKYSIAKKESFCILIQGFRQKDIVVHCLLTNLLKNWFGQQFEYCLLYDPTQTFRLF